MSTRKHVVVRYGIVYVVTGYESPVSGNGDVIGVYTCDKLAKDCEERYLRDGSYGYVVTLPTEVNKP